MSFFVKIILPVDVVTGERKLAIQERLVDAEMGVALLEMRISTVRAYRANIPSVVTGMREHLTDDVKQDMQNIVVPGLRTEIAARTFDYAQAGVADAQRRTGKPAADLLRRLSELGLTVRGAMGPRPVGSP